jgi:hypothetical protein
MTYTLTRLAIAAAAAAMVARGLHAAILPAFADVAARLDRIARAIE